MFPTSRLYHALSQFLSQRDNQLPRRKRTGYANRFAPKPQIWIAIRFFRCKQRGMYPY
ncbi:MAG: hypothetical protein KME35_06250 [Aphanocapsa sp. GSE-SYN-MK-11-07L]|nr:hypothetical protein [Aphanocapsa sp. GSE-SYN-MK-11-07L]